MDRVIEPDAPLAGLDEQSLRLLAAAGRQDAQQLLDDRTLPAGVFDARHLPGKHDQKTHGKGGRAGDAERPPIYRGAVVQATDVPLDRAKRIAAGEATIEDLQAAGVDTKDPGAFWYSGKEGFTAEDAKEHAYAEETANKGVQNVYDSQEVWGGELGTTAHFELPVVLEGRGPAGWSTADQEAPDLMGNSYIPKGSTISIDAVHYSPDGARWVKLDVDVETTIKQEGYEGLRTADNPAYQSRHLPGKHDQSTHGKGGSKVGDVNSSSDYGMQHRPPATSYGVSMNDPEDMFPDLLEHPEWYATGDKAVDRESMAAVRKAVAGGPDTPITVYRAAPATAERVNPGDWVTPSKTYAEQHRDRAYDEGDGTVLKATALAKELHSAGDLAEWGWTPGEGRSTKA